MSTYEKIYEAVKKIPKGRVATYKQVAAMAGNPGWARAVGNALHKNPDPEGIPCYRVVNREGRPAPGFAFGGEGVQRELLERDGVEFDEKGRVIMERYNIAAR
ncbi:MAG TPA: MGMT family protein [Candidatus Ornithomonoglobus merdipullorum]|uniref:MGMT family protein n=1 Tax=Candidatus Ornithomonoglobus merdipullorum TaxID=2840895 RepID=A0A9D1SE69_9FIRM|nr:MGMT family protein [Candidatus Ornithomonoglobus merdipullorum]